MKETKEGEKIAVRMGENSSKETKEGEKIAVRMGEDSSK